MIVEAADPRFDATDPAGFVMFRSCRAGYPHSVVLGEAALDGGAQALARAILAAAEVSHLKAARAFRETS